MFVLYETPAGYAIFKLVDEKKLKEVDNLYLEFQTPEKANKLLKLKHFEKFSDTTEALAAGTAAVEGKVAKPLKKTLKKIFNDEVQASLLVADAKLGNAIKEKFDVQCVYNTGVQELMRCIRQQADSLLSGLPKREMTAMALGLAHSLSRYKLKFSPDKIDTMIVQAQCLLDDLDKELNNYMMRAREWYGWHFPELGKIITDNIAFVKTIQLVGTRDHMAQTDLSDILPEDVEARVKEAAEISMGTEISDEDIINIKSLCDEILSINEYRGHLYDYLKMRMMAIAPNLTVLVGETVGARLIAHAGSLINLAKHPSSTLQILGAEKALFRALKTKKDTPKYGLIFHAQLVGKASTKNKGKMSRSLAAKASLSTRVDAFGEEATFELGTAHKVKLEARLRLLEEGNLRRLSGTGKAKAKLEKYHAKSEIFTYQAEADSTIKSNKRKFSETDEQAEAPLSKKQKKKQEPEQSTPAKKQKPAQKSDSDSSDSDSSAAVPPSKVAKVTTKKPTQASESSSETDSDDDEAPPAKISKSETKRPAQKPKSETESDDSDDEPAAKPSQKKIVQKPQAAKDSSDSDSSDDDDAQPTKKVSKPQTVPIVKKAAQKSKSDSDSSDSDASSNVAPPTKTVKSQPKKPAQKSDSDSDSDSDSAPKVKQTPKKPAPKDKSDSDSSDSDDEDKKPALKPSKPQQTQASKKAKPDSDSSDSDSSDAAPEPAKPVVKQQKKPVPKPESDSDSDSDAPPPAKVAKVQPKKAAKDSDDDSSSSDSEDAAPPQTKQKSAPTSAAKSKKPATKSSSDSSDSDSD